MSKKIDSFFRKITPDKTDKSTDELPSNQIIEAQINQDMLTVDERPIKMPRLKTQTFDMKDLERDPGIRKLIWDYAILQRDEVRRTYWMLGPYQPTPPNTPEYIDKKGRRFRPSWYKLFPDWLEFSLKTKRAYCLPCFLFGNPRGQPGANVFMIDGFQFWKKVNAGDKCAFLKHVGKDPNSAHKQSLKKCHDMMNSLQHIDVNLERQSSQQIAKNRLQLKVSIDVIKWLTFQGCAFRGHNEGEESNNRGNFIEMIKLLASYSHDVKAVVLENASQNANLMKNIVDEGNSASQRSEADGAYHVLTSFDFIFILHMMVDILEITDDLCQALQRKSQDILNAMHLVSTTKQLLQRLRETGWDSLLQRVNFFCEKHKIQIPDMNVLYSGSRGRSRHKKNAITVEHHYKVDVFIATLDTQLHEMNTRFKEHVVELLILSTALDPRDGFQSFKVVDICQLANKFYPEDFTDVEKIHLKIQLEHFQIEVQHNQVFQNLLTISDLCQMMAKTRKSVIYPLVDRLIKLILTLPVSTATTERAFSAMKIVKTRLRSKMEDDFLASSLITYIEKDIAMSFEIESIIDDFDAMKKRRVQFKSLK